MPQSNYSSRASHTVFRMESHITTLAYPELHVYLFIGFASLNLWFYFEILMFLCSTAVFVSSIFSYKSMQTASISCNIFLHFIFCFFFRLHFTSLTHLQSMHFSDLCCGRWMPCISFINSVNSFQLIRMFSLARLSLSTLCTFLALASN